MQLRLGSLESPILVSLRDQFIPFPTAHPENRSLVTRPWSCLVSDAGDAAPMPQLAQVIRRVSHKQRDGDVSESR